MPYSFPVQVRKMSCTADNRLLTVAFSGYLTIRHKFSAAGIFPRSKI